MRIRWTEPAAHDLTQICDYIERQNSTAVARRVALSIFDQIGMLGKFPGMGRPGRKPGTRELVISRLPYLAIYRVHAESVEILRILHGAQDWG